MYVKQFSAAGQVPAKKERPPLKQAIRPLRFVFIR
jgi:hypothetical protein